MKDVDLQALSEQSLKDIEAHQKEQVTTLEGMKKGVTFLYERIKQAAEAAEAATRAQQSSKPAEPEKQEEKPAKRK